jgi:predicted metalloprotease with PDZ domain
VLLNAFDVLGYPEGLKDRDIYLDVNFPSRWTVGTSLPKTDDGYYFATDYDKFVDSPLLFGEITNANTTVDGTEINLYTYSKTGQIKSDQILTDIQQVLFDASEFLNGLPVDHYSFIYLFNEFNAGALEHSYSSVYVLFEQQYTASYGVSLRDIAAHEFFHIVIPLNIHSEIIGDFNFADPTPSEHLWLYEGVTEWASDLMQYRNNHLTLTSLLSRFKSKKAIADNYYNPMISLSQMSLTCYTPVGGAQFGNVYNKGALVAALLDIRLLELSGGTKGLREVILELIDTYGPNNAFSEATFFEDLTAMTYPEIEDFINRYIKGTDELPLTEYFEKIGITYDPETNTFTPQENLSEEQQLLFDKWSVNF